MVAESFLADMKQIIDGYRPDMICFKCCYERKKNKYKLCGNRKITINDNQVILDDLLKNKITLTHDYYQPITMAIEKLRETINTHTKIVGRVKKLESIPDASKRTNGKVTIVYLDENDSKKTVSVQLAKDDYNKAIEAHESGSHVEVIGEIEDNGKRKKLMTAESFSIID